MMKPSPKTGLAYFRFEAATADAWFTPGRFGILLGLFFFCAFPEVIAGMQTFVLRDFGLYSYPVASYWKESFWRGEVPLWNPLSSCGLPFLAQWSTMVLYPLTLLYMLCPLTWMLPVFSFLHLHIGGMGMYFLARRWTGSAFGGAVAGLLFCFNGLSLSSLVWPHYAVAIAWMPWIVLSAERGMREGGRHILLAAIFGSMQMLSGMPEIILLTWIFAAGIWGWLMIRNPLPRTQLLWRFGLQVLLVTALCAAQLAPFAQLLSASQRSLGFSDARWSIPGTGLASFLVPLFYTFNSQEGVIFQYTQYLVSSYYLGIASVWLGIIAVSRVREVRVAGLCLVTLASALLALGNNGFVFPAFKTLIPVLGVARYPVKFLFLTMLTAPLLAAFGVRSYLRSPATTKCHGTKWHVVLLGLLLGIIGAIGWFAHTFPMPMDKPWATEWNALSRAGFLVLISGALWIIATTSVTSRGIAIRVGVLMLIFADIWTHAPPLMTTIPPFAYEKGLLAEKLGLKPLPHHGESRLMIKPAVDVDFHYSGLSNQLNAYLVGRSIFFGDANLLDDIPKVNGFYSLSVERAQEVIDRFYLRNENAEPLKDFLGVSQFTSATNGLEFAARTNYLPLITGGQQPEFAEPTAMLNSMFGSNFNPLAVVYLPPEVSGQLGFKQAGHVHVTSFSASNHRLEAVVEADAPGLVVVAQSHYPAWRSAVNNEPAIIWRANHAFQCIRVPAGRSLVSFTYLDRRFLLGGAISLASLAACLVAMFRIRSMAARTCGSGAS